MRTGVVVELVHADGKTETVRPSFVIGAGGAHSVTRHSMSEPLEGTTYRGHFLVADIAMPAPFPRDEAGVICGPNGLLLLAPLPGGRWISFQDLEEDVETVPVEEVVARVEARLGGKYRPTDVAWFAPFRMHRRIVSRLADGQRFLIGDAAHLSSPFGGEGLNAGLHDGYDLAWKLALVLRGHARRSLLDDYTVERQIADRHVLDVSDQVHTLDRRRCRRRPPAPRGPGRGRGSDRRRTVRNSRAMIDVDYAGSPLVVDQARQAAPAPAAHIPGSGTPTGRAFGGNVAPRARLRNRRGRRRRSRGSADAGPSSSQITHNPSVDPVRAGLPTGGVVMIRPDGHIGFRLPVRPAPSAFTALDRHLSSYLIPAIPASPVRLELRNA